MTVWVTADWHLFHRNIRLYEPSRPEDFEAVILDNCRKLVGPDDLVYNLGDVTFGRREETAALMAGLPGRWELILGNHDGGHTKKFFRDIGFAAVHKYILLERATLQPIPLPMARFPTAESIRKSIDDAIVAELAGEPEPAFNLRPDLVMLAHHPRGQRPGQDAVFDAAGCSVLIHGHSHSKPSRDPRGICVSVEQTAYAPVRLADMLGCSL